LGIIAKCLTKVLTQETTSMLQQCNVPIFGFPYPAVKGNPMSLCKPNQRSEMRITVSLGNLEELYGAQASPFTIFHR
jgi:hypothetical protein